MDPFPYKGPATKVFDGPIEIQGGLKWHLLMITIGLKDSYLFLNHCP